MLNIIKKIAAELHLKESQIHNGLKLLIEDDCTIPFVARYRKEMTGSMDEVSLRSLRDRYIYLTELHATKIKYLKGIEERCQTDEKLREKFPEIREKFLACETKQELEDLYLPFKPKRRTRAMIAKEKGLEPLLEKILAERATLIDLKGAATKFVTAKNANMHTALRVENENEALIGASDILAEKINEDATVRALVRNVSYETGFITAKKIDDYDLPEPDPLETKHDTLRSKKKGDATKYENYWDYREPIKSAVPHRIMAVRRGEAEKALKVNIEVDTAQIEEKIVTSQVGSEAVTEAVRTWIREACLDAYRRLISPSIETELRLLLKSKAEEEAIKVFAKNLERRLLLPPLPNHVVMGIDPGLRTGSKVAVVTETGGLIEKITIFPDYHKLDSPKNQEIRTLLVELMKKHNVQCVAIGNGTGSREIDRFVTSILREENFSEVKRVIVSEAGASVYSTDDIAREEFPDLDPAIRSAISIARRLQDPLAELVKIDPRSIGVGQYQHDVNVTKLKSSLEEIVESCVNKVGVNLNTASYKLLSYVSGIGPALAKSVITYREKGGKFRSRDQIMEVTGFGPKAFEQSAGFLRIPDSQNPLDNSAVHPERYEIVNNIVKDLQKSVNDIIGNKELINSINWERYVTATVGMPTLRDIALELEKPGRDPREQGTRLLFSEKISEITDLKPSMILKGTVSNVTNFGAFVDLGVHQDGLIHISELSGQFVDDPTEVIAVGDVIDVRVVDVDLKKNRISLSRKLQPDEPRPPRQPAKPEFNRPQGGRPHDDRRPRQGGDNQHRQREAGQDNRRYDGAKRGPPPPRDDKRGDRQPPKQKKPETHYTVEDLLNKFNKK